MESEYIQEFIKIIKEQNEIDKKNLSDFTIKKINEIVMKDNNIIGILYNLDSIDVELNGVSFWIKYAVYNKIFSSELYNLIMKKIEKDHGSNPDYNISNDNYYKFMLYGGLICETIKIFYYNHIIKQFDYLDKKKNIVEKAFQDTFIEEKNNEIKFIKQLYEDAVKYFHQDDIFNDITRLINENGLSEYVL